ncbi:LysR family transcriptional regulator [Halomonas sp. McH1-25]|nr:MULTISPECIES: LysR family transcriptional regulator [unclassified Halomonas]MCG7602282.1 LysR family transcriptional regulator [Halomonas sp. McH1-25]MCP1363559.1 LysR family transcriptional regulator [Halomonas sp. BBD45]MCP1366203.1 LysR family transcriptional regulator [Halomonas sp. BBD48]
MDLHHLKLFCLVAEELNLTRAAAKLHMTQPPLSRNIKALESELGSQLFVRGPQGLSLTPTGSYLYDQARQILAHVEMARSMIGRLERGKKPLVGVGFVPSVFYDWLPILVKELRQKDNIELALAEMTTIQQIQALKEGRIDIGFGRLRIDDPDIVQQIIVEEPLIAALPSGHPLENSRPSLENLAKYPMVLFPASPRPSLSDMIQGIFRRRNISINIVQETNELQTTLGLVASGLGITLVPEQVKNVQRTGVTYIELLDGDVTSPIICSTRKDGTKNENIREINLAIENFTR